MKDEVPPALIDAHVKMVEKAVTEGKEVDQEFGLDQSGIAGTVLEKEEGILIVGFIKISHTFLMIRL
jgi:hypothetical protein